MVELLEKMAEEAPDLKTAGPLYLNEMERLKSSFGEKSYVGRTTDYDCQACVSGDCACNVCDL